MDADILARACEAIASGKSLRQFCREEELPESTVRTWITNDSDAFAQSVRARELGCDALADECLDIADAKGDAADKRIRIDTRLRLIGKWSQRYAEKPAVDARTVTVNMYDLDRLESARLDELERILADARASEGGAGAALPPPLH